MNDSFLQYRELLKLSVKIVVQWLALARPLLSASGAPCQQGYPMGAHSWYAHGTMDQGWPAKTMAKTLMGEAGAETNQLATLMEERELFCRSSTGLALSRSNIPHIHGFLMFVNPLEQS